MDRQRQSRLRIMLLAMGVSFWGLVVVGRLVQLQVFQRPAFERLAAKQSERTQNLAPRRGPILDRDGRALAVSIDAESLYAVPQDIEDPQATAAALSRALGFDAARRRNLAVQLGKASRSFEWVERKLDPARAQAVRELGLPGIGFLTESRRYYPKRELASHLLGYVGLDDHGMGGIEADLDDRIRGRAAKVVVRTDARRQPVEHVEKPSTEGHTVVLTIDESIQHAAETELEKAVAATRSIAGFVVVMDPRNGEILALANQPTFNPNRYGAYSDHARRNRAVSDIFEPGSIFKIFTAAAGLQEKVVDPDEVIDCGGGFVEVSGVRINDHGVFHQLSFRDVIARSSDVGVVRVAQRLGREQMSRYLRDFGFGAATGVGLRAEARGLLRPPRQWNAVSLASISFGQEVGVTAVQMTAAVAAVANGGYLMRPHLVKRVLDAQGRPVYEAQPHAERRVLEPETVDVLTEILKRVVTDGTGKRAAIDGYVVAGKTGTAQKFDFAAKKYSMIDHVASFVGFAPASRPEIVVLVSLDEPKGPANQGGDVAAPLFAKIAEAALRRLAVPPDAENRVLRAVAGGAPALQAALTAPDPALQAVAHHPGDPLLMPDLRGRSAREAAAAAARRGLIVELRGTGRVVEQAPAPGTELEAGMACVLTLAPWPPAAPVAVASTLAEGPR